MKITLKTFLALLFAASLMTSCSKDETSSETNQINDAQSDELVNGVALGLRGTNLGIGDRTIISFIGEQQRDSIIGRIVKEIYEIELNTGVNNNNEQTYDEFHVNILVNEYTGLIQIEGSPVVQVVVPSNSTTNGDDVDCGGKAGDGWKSFGTCQTQSCTETKSKEAAAELKNNLTSGKCLDIRIKRNTFSARVCARVINC